MAHTEDFTHLHLHSQYSLLDGAIRIEELLPSIKDQGMRSVAVTDHGNMYGAVHFFKAAKKHGIKPILGCEVYVATRGHKDRTSRDSSHLVLLAKNNAGYKNLSYLVSMGFLEGFYYNPRIDLDLLRRHSSGLFATSACLGGCVSRLLLQEGESAAAQRAKELRDIFEPGHFFLEIQDNGFAEQPRVNAALLEIGRTYNIPMVATADAHYLRPEDSQAHEILMCIGQSRSLTDFRAKHHHSDLLYVKSPQEMWSSFEKSCPEAVTNAARIAAACQVELNLSDTYLPDYRVPPGHTRESFLEQIAQQGLQQRIQEAHYAIAAGHYQERLAYELGVINKMGFAGYFLIVWDFIRYAKEEKIPVGPGRGSGAGSLVAWALRITDLDPIPYDLLFERFLNPERVSMPDFDIDFCQDRRGEVIDYVGRHYGRNQVGQIVTYSQLSTKSVIKDVGRVLEVPFAEVNELTKLIPSLVGGKKVTIDQALEMEPKLRSIQQEKPIYEQVIRIARRLEGLNRQTGIHAAGIVIGDKPLWEYVPMCRGKEGELVTQFAKDEVEAAGLVKFDFLGLKTLTVIANAVKHINHRSDKGPLGDNATFDIARAPLDDAQVYQLIASGDTDGVFQLESSGFKELLKRLRPDCFEDVVAAVALYRPGPLDAGMVDDYIARKHGKQQVDYPHPVCQPILAPTYGVIVYQEQVMRIAVALCGFSMGEADLLRKAMGKKKADVMAEMRQKFVQGAITQSSMSPPAADELFTQIEKFAGYAFNKSHSAAYAVISYQTAYLKTYYPVEFMAALLSTEMRDQDTVVRYIQSARERGIAIEPPDVNRSERDFSVHASTDGSSRSILFGLGAVKGIGDAAIDAIVEARQKQLFNSIFGFCEAVDIRKINRKVLEALVKCGAFDGFGQRRAQLLAVAERASEAGQAAQKDRDRGQFNMFHLFAQTPPTAPDAAAPRSDADAPAESGGSPASSTVQEIYPDIDEWPQKELLAYEKEALGFYITGHPLDTYAPDLARLCTATTTDIAQHRGQKGDPRPHEVTVGGIVAHLRERALKNGTGRMAFVQLEDLHGSCEVLVFSKVFAECETILKGDCPILVHGAVTTDGDDEEQAQVKIRATHIETLAEARLKKTQRLELKLLAQQLSDDNLKKLRDILVTNHGSVPTSLHITQAPDFEAVVTLPAGLNVSPSDDLIVRLDRLFGQHVLQWH